jgi:hypothetical protein
MADHRPPPWPRASAQNTTEGCENGLARCAGVNVTAGGFLSGFASFTPDNAESMDGHDGPCEVYLTERCGSAKGRHTPNDDKTARRE